MLFTKALEDMQNLYNDFDIEEEERNFAFETALYKLECNSIMCEADHIAIEAYNDYNGNMSILESQFEVVKEEAEKSIFEKIKAWISKAWNWIKNMAIKIKNWVLGLFSKRKAFIDKYKNDTRSVSAELIDFNKAKSIIMEFSNEATVMTEKIKTYYKDIKDGKGMPMPKDNATPFQYVMDNKSLFGVSHDYESLDKAVSFVKDSVMKEKKNVTIKLKDFCKGLEDFNKIKDDANMKTFDKRASKIGLSILAFFSTDTNKTVGFMQIDKSKTLISAARDATSLVIKIITGYATAIKEVMSTNMEAIQKAIPNNKED